MSDLNSYAFTGRLGADAETRYTNNGTAVWSARVAVGYGWGDNKGTNWITVKAFGKRAEGLEKLGLVKGAQIGGAGELQVREFDRKDGSKGTSLEVTVNDVTLFGGKSEGGTSSARQAPSNPRRDAEPADQFPDDDIPFATNRSRW